MACWSVFRFFLLNFRSRETVWPSCFMTRASGSSAAHFGASVEAANTTKATLQIILFIFTVCSQKYTGFLKSELCSAQYKTETGLSTIKTVRAWQGGTARGRP